MEQSSESFEAFTRELLGAGDGAESALMATSAGPAPFFGSPFLNLPAALADDAALFDFDMPAGDPQALKQPNEAMQAPQSAATQALPTMAADTMTLQPTDVLMAPFLDPVDLLMPQNEAGEPTDPPSAGSAPDGNTAATGTPSSMQLTVVREKNRIAQRKYRAKQRQRQNESSSKIAELTRKLAEMQRKQTELLNREKLFERFIATQTLKLQPQNGGLQVCEGTMSAFRPHTDIKGIADAALAAAAADGPSRDGSCEEIFPISKIWASHSTMKLAFGAGMTRMKLCNEKLTFTASGQRIELTREQVAHLSVGEYAALWKEIINGLAGCLLRAKDDMESPSGKRLLELIVEARNLKKTLGFLRPETLAEYAKQTAEENGPVPQELWRSMAASLTLSPGQRENCVLLRNAAFKHLGALMRQRSELAKSMTTFATLPTAESCGVEANDYLGSSSAAAQLHSMLREENGFTAQLMMNLYGRILTPLQTAHVHVLAYPYECSALSLLDAIATGTGTAAGCGDSAVATVSELLQQGAASAEQTLPPLCEVIARPTATEARAICCC